MNNQLFRLSALIFIAILLCSCRAGEVKIDRSAYEWKQRDHNNSKSEVEPVGSGGERKKKENEESSNSEASYFSVPENAKVIPINDSRGVINEYYASGKIRAKYPVIITKSGKFIVHGQVKFWHENQKLHIAYQMEKGHKVDEMRSWHANGRPASVVKFKERRVYFAISWNKEGEKISEDYIHYSAAEKNDDSLKLEECIRNSSYRLNSMVWLDLCPKGNKYLFCLYLKDHETVKKLNVHELYHFQPDISDVAPEGETDSPSFAVNLMKKVCRSTVFYIVSTNGYFQANSVAHFFYPTGLKQEIKLGVERKLHLKKLSWGQAQIAYVAGPKEHTDVYNKILPSSDPKNLPVGTLFLTVELIKISE